MTTPNHNEETQFLEGRKIRLDANQQTRRRRTDDLHDFWQSLHKDSSSWKNRLDALLTQHPQCVTAAQRAQGLSALEHLEKELKVLRKKSLADLEVPELPAADVRLLHKEFTTLSTLLETAREQLSPRSKFVFKRYRQAIQKQKMQAPESELHALQQKQERQHPPRAQVEVIGGAVIQDKSDSTIVVLATGEMIVSSMEGNDARDGLMARESQGILMESVSLLVQNISHCDITVMRGYKALHIQNVKHSTIYTTIPVPGAIHVTSCHHLNLQVVSHQLRLHESSNVICHASVQSGPILEDCTGIVFHQDPGDKGNLVRHAKDFNWLRNGIPSPNFTIVDSSAPNADTKTTSILAVPNDARTVHSLTVSERDEVNLIDAVESDEEDEL